MGTKRENAQKPGQVWTSLEISEHLEAYCQKVRVSCPVFLASTALLMWSVVILSHSSKKNLPPLPSQDHHYHTIPPTHQAKRSGEAKRSGGVEERSKADPTNAAGKAQDRSVQGTNFNSVGFIPNPGQLVMAPET